MDLVTEKRKDVRNEKEADREGGGQEAGVEKMNDFGGEENDLQEGGSVKEGRSVIELICYLCYFSGDFFKSTFTFPKS